MAKKLATDVQIVEKAVPSKTQVSDDPSVWEKAMLSAIAEHMRCAAVLEDKLRPIASDANGSIVFKGTKGNDPSARTRESQLLKLKELLAEAGALPTVGD